MHRQALEGCVQFKNKGMPSIFVTPGKVARWEHGGGELLWPWWILNEITCKV